MVRNITLKGIKEKQQRDREEPNDDDRIDAAIGLVKSRFGRTAGGKIGGYLKSLEAHERKRESHPLPPNVSDLILAFAGYPKSPSVLGDEKMVSAECLLRFFLFLSFFRCFRSLRAVCWSSR